MLITETKGEQNVASSRVFNASSASGCFSCLYGTSFGLGRLKKNMERMTFLEPRSGKCREQKVQAQLICGSIIKSVEPSSWFLILRLLGLLVLKDPFLSEALGHSGLLGVVNAVTRVHLRYEIISAHTHRMTADFRGVLVLYLL